MTLPRRKPLKRTPLSPKPHPENPFSTFGPRKKHMPKQSAKKRQENRNTDSHRAFYVQAADGRCECCQELRKLECHEITAGSSRHRAVYQPNVWLALCRACHEEIQGQPFAMQCEVKFQAVRRSINTCLGRDAV